MTSVVELQTVLGCSPLSGFTGDDDDDVETINFYYYVDKVLRILMAGFFYTGFRVRETS